MKIFNSTLIIFGSIVFFILIFNILLLSNRNCTIKAEVQYVFQKLPRFWTNTGFCPLGDVSKYLLSKDIRHHLNLIGALPNHAIANIRIHWLLDLIDIHFEDNTLVYDFKKLDILIDWINEAGLSLGFEFMGNPNDIFTNKTNLEKAKIWNELSYQIAQRYLLMYGEEKLFNWKFETWNEPDLKNYNQIQFNEKTFIEYAMALKIGLLNANVNLKLRGPAGLFKNKNKHPLCWSSLKFCNDNMVYCPFDILTFHRKGDGNASEIAAGGELLLSEIFREYPNLRDFPISNDEADPIAGWSIGRDFQSDINYAVDLVNTVFDHWSLKLNNVNFKNLESISHDNAFLSYHPYEFNQRTLFARFQMNNSEIQYSQFIAKPVYIALGMLGHLGDYAETTIHKKNISYLITTSKPNDDFYVAIIATSTSNNLSSTTDMSFSLQLPENKKLALIIEVLETNYTNPIELWNSYGKPSYPDSEQREWMRRVQGPKVIEMRNLTSEETTLQIQYEFKAPWVALVRICDVEHRDLAKPDNIRIFKVTKGEILIFWDFKGNHNCVKSFEVNFKPKLNATELMQPNRIMNFKRDRSWLRISRGWRVPFRYFQFASKDNVVDGLYKVRAVYISKKSTPFSIPKAYVEEL